MVIYAIAVKGNLKLRMATNGNIKNKIKIKAKIEPYRQRMSNYIKTFLIIVILAFYGLISGCSTPKYLPASNIKIIAKDSMVVHTELVSVALPLESHSIVTPTKKSHLETSVATSDAEIDTLGMLHHTLTNKKDSIKTKIQYVDKIVYRDSVEVREVPVEVEKKVPYIPKFHQFTFALFWIFVLFIVVRLLIKLGLFKHF